jgi:antitoxin component of MazEF toxin-antitoxin module
MESESFVKYVRKTGTSLGVSIPSEIIDIMRLKENEMIRVTIEKVKSK